MFLTKKKPLFRTVEIATTYECNFNCKHCSAATLDKKRTLNLEDYKSLGMQCKKNNIPCVIFTGGEPLVDSRIENIIKLFNPKETFIWIATNGALLTKKKLEKFKKLGVDGFQISLDSVSPESSFRDYKGCFNKILNAIKLSKEMGFNVTIVYTLTHTNIKNDFLDMIELAKKMETKLHVSLAAPCGKLANYESLKKYALSDDDRNFLKKLRKKYSFITRDIDNTYLRIGCPAGTERVCLTPSGEVMPCTKIHVSFGNVKKDSIIDIRNRMEKYEILTKSPPICICAESEDFIKNNMSRCFGKKNTLLTENEFFN